MKQFLTIFYYHFVQKQLLSKPSQQMEAIKPAQPAEDAQQQQPHEEQTQQITEPPQETNQDSQDEKQTESLFLSAIIVDLYTIVGNIRVAGKIRTL